MDSSYTFRERFDFGAIPRLSANSSHLDGFLGGGGGWKGSRLWDCVDW